MKNNCNELVDLELIQKSLEDINYFACIYNRYESRLLKYISKVSFASEEEAQDILQESFIKIWRNLHTFDQDLKLSSWLYRIVHNETISFCRKKKSYGKNQKISEKDGLTNIPFNIEPEDEPEKNDMLTHEILNRLNVKYREVLVLKFLEKLSYEEISDILRIPEGTVAIRINRAKKEFKKIAEKEHIEFNR